MIQKAGNKVDLGELANLIALNGSYRGGGDGVVGTGWMRMGWMRMGGDG